jgi:hypothetical protein
VIVTSVPRGIARDAAEEADRALPGGRFT